MFDVLYKTIQETTRQIMKESNLEEIIRNKYNELSKTKEFDDMITQVVKNEIKACLESMIDGNDEIYEYAEKLVKKSIEENIRKINLYNDYRL
jgi:hypothetical protein